MRDEGTLISAKTCTAAVVRLLPVAIAFLAQCTPSKLDLLSDRDGSVDDTAVPATVTAAAASLSISRKDIILLLLCKQTWKR